jgi:hypothetical protein
VGLNPVDGGRYGAPIGWAFSQLPRHQSTPKKREKRTIGKDLKAQMKVTDFNRLCLECVFSSGRDNISVVLQVKARNYLGFDVAEESASFETQGPRGPTPGCAGGADTCSVSLFKFISFFTAIYGQLGSVRTRNPYSCNHIRYSADP